MSRANAPLFSKSHKIRLDCGAIGKHENCTVTVHLSFASRDFHCLVDGDLFLPESWYNDRDRCREAKIPDEIVYRPKTEIALELYERALRGHHKKSFKIDFNPGHPFRYFHGSPSVEEINLNSTLIDKSYVRQILSFETFRDAGVPYSEAFPVRIQNNGEFYSVATFIEQPNEEYLRRNGLDPDGAL